MAATHRTHRADVHTTGEVTLDEVQALIDEARRAHIPGDTPATWVEVRAGGRVLSFSHDFDLAARDPGPHPVDAVTERLRTPVLRPSIGHLHP